ncbi:MAG: hypothetical protein AVDCRST_MAG62-1518, partial [uncultured Sphingomonas sp.]
CSSFLPFPTTPRATSLATPHPAPSRCSQASPASRPRSRQRRQAPLLRSMCLRLPAPAVIPRPRRSHRSA